MKERVSFHKASRISFPHYDRILVKFSCFRFLAWLNFRSESVIMSCSRPSLHYNHPPSNGHLSDKIVVDPPLHQDQEIINSSNISHDTRYPRYHDINNGFASSASGPHYDSEKEHRNNHYVLVYRSSHLEDHDSSTPHRRRAKSGEHGLRSRRPRRGDGYSSVSPPHAHRSLNSRHGNDFHRTRPISNESRLPGAQQTSRLNAKCQHHRLEFIRPKESPVRGFLYYFTDLLQGKSRNMYIRRKECKECCHCR